MPFRLATLDAAERRYLVLFAATGVTLGAMVLYVAVRVTTLWHEGYTWADAVVAALLLAAEAFLMLHGIGYFVSVVKAARRDAATIPRSFAPAVAVPVAVLVCAYNEAEAVLDETLAAVRAMDYPLINVYLLDDSTNEECRVAARRLATRYNATLRARRTRDGYKAGAINDVVPELTEKYVAILDADQRPVQGWLKDVVPMLEADSRLALVQAPQVYVNTERLPVARAARFQQAVFFEYICEGKAQSNAIYCCGSNVVIARAALLDVEVDYHGRRAFFDESIVTEDFATSLRWHARGWRTEYVNQPYVLGLGPETLPAYFTQQMRWSMGSIAVGLRTLGLLLRHPGRLRVSQWWEYLLSGSYYLVGLANLVFIAAPVAFLLAGVTPLRTASDLYLLFFIPYILFTMNLFFFGMRLRGYPVKGIWLASALSFATSWVYARAAVVALLGLKRAFAVTPKGVGGAIPIYRMPIELGLFALTLTAALAGVHRLLFVGVDVAHAVTTIWAAYHAVLLSTLFVYFNRRARIDSQRLVFERVSSAA
jgi:cellulose synthase (UDP-forming)